MEKEYVSINHLRQIIFTTTKKLYYFDQDSYGNYIEIEFGCINLSDRQISKLLFRKQIGVYVYRFYTSYLNKITTIDHPYLYTIKQKDFKKISSRSRYF